MLCFSSGRQGLCHTLFSLSLKLTVRVRDRASLGTGPDKRAIVPFYKNHFWVNEVADPEPTSFLFMGAEARERREDLLAHPPLVPGTLFFSKEV